MKIIETEDPDIIRLRQERNGCLVVIGGLLFIWGLPVVATGLGLTNVVEDNTWYFRLTVLVIGMALALAGLSLILLRAGWTVDRRRGELTRWWKVLIPVKTTVLSLAGVTRLAYRPEPPEDDDPGPTGWFNLDLVGDPAEAPTTLDTYAEYDEGLVLAEPLAAFLNLPLDKQPPPPPSEDEPDPEAPTPPING
jgi:hypothetical protein